MAVLLAGLFKLSIAIAGFALLWVFAALVEQAGGEFWDEYKSWPPEVRGAYRGYSIVAYALLVGLALS